MTIHKLTVALDSRSYSICIGSGLTQYDETGDGGDSLLIPRLRGKDGVIVTNETIAPLYLSRVRKWLAAAGYQGRPVILPDGEEYKNYTTLQSLYRELYEAGLQRNGFICALGGGVIGDLAGFAAATYMRGIDLIQLPTTVLAQVDSAIGGKNGVNLEFGKNLIGSTYQPRVVISDVDFIETLPEKELLSGLGEVVKYGLLAGDDFISFLELNQTEIMERKSRSLAIMIHSCSRIKADYVERDEFDLLGVRAALNLGHTVGHALEKMYGFQKLPHGEAVSIGLVCALTLSVAMELLPESGFQRALQLISHYRLPAVVPEDADIDQMIELMRRDKKVAAGSGLSMVLLRGLGDPYLEDNVDPVLLREVLIKCKQPQLNP
ncbi:MAG: 3-dehydroquinate synthase [Deltaproteobacteria bacterium]|nr:3-dehydroquinate synthase [Deltaproteobacteria bacterium]